MRILRLDLKNFRNYSDLSWHPHSGINIISGNNAQGKTNILEAIFFCSTGRSFRTFRDKELISWTKEECLIHVFLEKNDLQKEVTASISKKGNTFFLLNGLKNNKNKIFQPNLSISFTPADLELVTGSPAERRKWIDFELGSYDHQYFFNIEKYQKILLQRNNLLKNYRVTKKADEIIDPWNTQLSFYGSRIIKSRINLLKLFFKYMKETFTDITCGVEDITFKYLSSIPIDKGMDTEELMISYEESLRKNINTEVFRQQTLFGPHRDDIVFFINGNEVKKYCSRGQQRSVVLAMKLSLIKMFFEEYREYPILLLDDVFLELDSNRQRGLDIFLQGEAQVFITTNNRFNHYFSGQAKVFKVAEGKILSG